MQDWRKFSREIDRPRIGASDSSIFLKPSLATLPFVRYPREQLYTRARMYCEPFRENNTVRGEASFITADRYPHGGRDICPFLLYFYARSPPRTQQDVIRSLIRSLRRQRSTFWPAQIGLSRKRLNFLGLEKSSRHKYNVV